MLGQNRIGRLFPAVFLLLAAPEAAAQTPMPRLRDGQPFTVKGKLQVVYTGWHRYLVLPLEHPYIADFGPDEGTKRVTAIEINQQGRDSNVADHVGEVIEVRGNLQLEGVSPYYWNGVMLIASTVTLPGGTVLRPELPQPRVPAGTDFYTVSVAMVPHQYEWRREAQNIETGDLLPDPAVDGCSLNGAGDVMNCLCVPGFTPVRAGLVPHPLPTTRWRDIPLTQFALPGMAQFALSDPGATKSQIVQVACKRNGQHKGSTAR